MTAPELESDLVRRFGDGLSRHGLRLPGGEVLQGVIIGHEVGLSGASSLGNTGAADLLMVTEDHRFWLIEAKLAASREAAPSFLFDNQLARYAASLERLGLERLHPRLQEYLYGRRAVLRPPASLARHFERCRTLAEVLISWCEQRGHASPGQEADAMVRSLNDQMRRRTLTLAALLDDPQGIHDEWLGQRAGERSCALLTVDADRPLVRSASMLPIATDAAGVDAPVLAPFDQIPQSFKPTPSTLPRVLSERAFELYSEIVAPTFERWTDGQWPEVKLSKVTDAAFSLDLQSRRGRSICLQIGRAALAGGGGAGAHPLKLIVNCIWAAEQVYESGRTRPEEAERDYSDLEALVVGLCLHAGMKVRGIAKELQVASSAWRRALQPKMRGDELRRPELVAVRERGEREGYGWADEEVEVDRQLLNSALALVGEWLGEPPYLSIVRPKSARKVPGTVRS